MAVAKLMALRLDQGDGVAALGPEWDGCFGEAGSVQLGRRWLEAVEAAAVPPGARACSLLLRENGEPAGLLPLLAGPGRDATGLTSPYSVLFRPLLPVRLAEAGGRIMGGALRRRFATVTLDALDPEWPGLEPWLDGVRRAGLVPLRFQAFGNWHEAVGGLGWDGYLAGRPGALRETLRRRGRAAERDGSLRFDTVRDRDGLAAGLRAYEAVYLRSWKVPEPFPGFADALLSRLSGAGEMRLGVLWRGGDPIAAQYWTVAGGVATVLKLAHDERHKALSPGTLLTAHMIRGLLEEDGVSELDFGRGDDPYKRQWAGRRRGRVGVVLANPLRPAGLAAIARHAAGRLLRRVRR